VQCTIGCSLHMQLCCWLLCSYAPKLQCVLQRCHITNQLRNPTNWSFLHVGCIVNNTAPARVAPLRFQVQL
jgi:hypothetical protein